MTLKTIVSRCTKCESRYFAERDMRSPEVHLRSKIEGATRLNHG